MIAKKPGYYVKVRPIIENKIFRSYAPYVFSLTAIIVFLLLALKPTISTILNLQKDIEDSKQVLETLKEKGKNIIQGKRNYDNLPYEVKEAVKVAVPEQSHVINLIKHLESAISAQATGSALQIQPVVLVDFSTARMLNPNLGEFGFTYNMEGSYNELLSSLERISKISRLVKIENVGLSKQQEGQTTLSISGKAYFLK